MFENPLYNYPIDRILEALGCRKGGKDMYFSPLREETEASLHIDRAKNLWFDHGAGMGGTNVQLVMMARKCSMKDAHRFIATLDPTLTAPMEKKAKESESSNDIKTVRNLRNPYLLNYLESRKIPADLAKRYCKEVIIRNNDKGQTYTLIGFENNAGGYALKSPSGFKSTTKAGITTINTDGSRTVVPSTPSVLVFEGFFDFLSWQVLQSSKTPSCDVVVLNSVNNLVRATDYLKLHDRIICFLDNDIAGQKACASIKSTISGKEIFDMSHLYQHHKDLNEMLQESRGFTSKISLKL